MPTSSEMHIPLPAAPPSSVSLSEQRRMNDSGQADWRVSSVDVPFTRPRRDRISLACGARETHLVCDAFCVNEAPRCRSIGSVPSTYAFAIPRRGGAVGLGFELRNEPPSGVPDLSVASDELSESVFKKIDDADGKRCVEIMVRDDGLFRFVESSEITEDGYTFWTPTHWSGLYVGATSAESDARSILPWLRSPASN